MNIFEFLSNVGLFIMDRPILAGLIAIGIILIAVWIYKKLK